MIWPVLSTNKQGKFRWIELYATKEQADKRVSDLKASLTANVVSEYTALPPLEVYDRKA